MYEWIIYWEDEETGERRQVATVWAGTMAEALEKGCELTVLDSGELVAIRKPNNFKGGNPYV